MKKRKQKKNIMEKHSAKKSTMWQLSRQNIAFQKNVGSFVCVYFPLKKQALARFEPRTFAVSGVVVTSRLNVPETFLNLNSL